MKKKIIAVLALVVASLCLFTACKTDGPGVNENNNEKPQNTAQTDITTYDDSYVVVMNTVNEASTETVTYYFEKGIYKNQSSIIVYAAEDAAKIGFNPVQTYENAKLEGNTVSYNFVSKVFEGMKHSEVAAYWERQFSMTPDFHKNSTVKIEKIGGSAADPNAEKDTQAVQLIGESEAAKETVTYYFVNNVYVSQSSEIIYATEDVAKQNFPMVSGYDAANLDGSTITYNFISTTFTGMTREQVVQYWEDQFKTADGFYAGYKVSVIDTSAN